jgi:hypothetical protein
VILYHATASDETLTSILKDGFADHASRYTTAEIHEGVWLSDRRLSAGEGGLSGHEPLLRVEIPEDVIRQYEWVNDPWVGYREWLVPATIVNRYPREYVDESFDESHEQI